MAIKPMNDTIGSDSSTELPYGGAQNLGMSDKGGISAVPKRWWNEFFGFCAALFAAANVTPSDSVDTATTSQIYNALALNIGSITTNLTADTGSAQDATSTTDTCFIRIGTCANIGDSITLPASVAGRPVTIINDGANSADVFPFTDENFVGSADNAAVAVGAGSCLEIVGLEEGAAASVGNWAIKYNA